MQFSDNANVLLEHCFQEFWKGKKNFQQITVPGGKVVDLQYFRMINIYDPMQQWKVIRVKLHTDRRRNYSSARWIDNDILP